MTPRTLIVALVAVFTFTALQAQQDRSAADSRLFGSPFFGASHGFRAHPGFFPFPGVFPVVELSEQLSRVLVMEHLLFGHHRPTRIGRSPRQFSGTGVFGLGHRTLSLGAFGHHRPTSIGRSHRHFSGGMFGGVRAAGFGRGYRTPLYSSRDFVEEWSGREPPSRVTKSSLKDSALLAEGMEDAEVMRRLGSPLQRVQLGNREVWTYSGYSLLFEGGALREIR